MAIRWHDISDPSHRTLDDLAAAYELHPARRGCANGAQRTKAEDGRGRYLFLIFKLPSLEGDQRLKTADLSLFVGRDFLITVHHGPASPLDGLQKSCDTLRSDQVLHHVMDVVVEAYLSVLDRLEDDVEALNDVVVDRPGPCVLKQLGEVRSDLLEVRRILSAMRHVASQLRHSSNSLISRELHPFLGDVHDDLAIMLDTIAGERDRLAAVLDIYFSSLANRTTEATKTLTLLGTIVLPTLVITSIFGMNVPYPGWTRSNWIFGVLLGLSLASTAALAWFLRRRDYLPRSSRSPSREASRRDDYCCLSGDSRPG